MARSTYTIAVRFKAYGTETIKTKMSGVEKAAKRMKASFRDLNTAVEMSMGAFHGLRSAGHQMQIVGRYVTRPLMDAFKVGAAFEDKMSQIRAMMRLEDPKRAVTTLDSLMSTTEESIRNLAKNTIYYSNDVADAFIKMKRGGLEVKEIAGKNGFGGALEGVLNLAMLDPGIKNIGKFSEQLTGIFTSLKSQGLIAGAGQFNDFLAKVGHIANRTNIDVAGLVTAFGYFGPHIKESRMQLEEILAVMAAFRQVGVAPSRIGTMMRQLIGRQGMIVKKKAIKGMARELGMKPGDLLQSFIDPNDPKQFIPLNQFMLKAVGYIKQIADKKGISVAAPMMQALFNTRGRSGAQLTDMLKNMWTALTVSAKDVKYEDLVAAAKERQNSVQSKLMIMKSLWQDIQISIFKAKGGFIHGFVDKAKNLLMDLTSYISILSGRRKRGTLKSLFFGGNVEDSPVAKFVDGFVRGVKQASAHIKSIFNSFIKPLMDKYMGTSKMDMAETLGMILGKIVVYGPALMAGGFALTIMAGALGGIASVANTVVKLFGAAYMFLRFVGFGSAGMGAGIGLLVAGIAELLGMSAWDVFKATIAGLTTLVSGLVEGIKAIPGWLKIIAGVGVLGVGIWAGAGAAFAAAVAVAAVSWGAKMYYGWWARREDKNAVDEYKLNEMAGKVMWNKDGTGRRITPFGMDMIKRFTLTRENYTQDDPRYKIGAAFSKFLKDRNMAAFMSVLGGTDPGVLPKGMFETVTSKGVSDENFVSLVANRLGMKQTEFLVNNLAAAMKGLNQDKVSAILSNIETAIKQERPVDVKIVGQIDGDVIRLVVEQIQAKLARENNGSLRGQIRNAVRGVGITGGSRHDRVSSSQWKTPGASTW